MISMPLYCALLLLLWAALVQSHRRHQALYRIVRVPDVDPVENTFLILREHQARLIGDNRTIHTLGYHPDNLAVLTKDEFARLKVGKPLPPIYKEVTNPDEIMRVELLKNKVLVGSLLREVAMFGRYINAGVALFHGRFLAFVGLAWTIPGMNDGKSPDEFLYHRWVNLSMAPYQGKGEFLGINEFIERPQPTEIKILGQDPRCVVVHEDGVEALHVSFTNRFVAPIRMGKAVLVRDPATNVIRLRDYFFFIDINSAHIHKNWMPFVYNETRVMYISYVNPLTVVEVQDIRTEKVEEGTKVLRGNANTISEVQVAKLDWHYGELRGGSNALFLPEHGVYVAVFHSSRMLDGNSMTTYFMGAITFSAHPPFKLLKISPLPIMDEQLYTGPWSPFRNRHIDFVAFPTSLFRDPRDPSQLGLAFGHQDDRSMVATIRIQELLDSLIPAVYE